VDACCRLELGVFGAPSSLALGSSRLLRMTAVADFVSLLVVECDSFAFPFGGNINVFSLRGAPA
jgi:hypothetical protein